MIKKVILRKSLVGRNFVLYRYYCVVVGLANALILIEKASVWCSRIPYTCGCSKSFLTKYTSLFHQLNYILHVYNYMKSILINKQNCINLFDIMCLKIQGLLCMLLFCGFNSEFFFRINWILKKNRNFYKIYLLWVINNTSVSFSWLLFFLTLNSETVSFWGKRSLLIRSYFQIFF